MRPAVGHNKSGLYPTYRLQSCMTSSHSLCPPTTPIQTRTALPHRNLPLPTATRPQTPILTYLLPPLFFSQPEARTAHLGPFNLYILNATCLLAAATDRGLHTQRTPRNEKNHFAHPSTNGPHQHQHRPHHHAPSGQNIRSWGWGSERGWSELGFYAKLFGVLPAVACQGGTELAVR